MNFQFFTFLVAIAGAQRVEWDALNLPNPTAGDFKRCNMKTSASICDPDKILTEAERYRLNHELHQLESRTRQDHAPDFCQKKGITPAMAVVKHVRGASEAAVKDMANQMLKNWDLDQQCQKSVVFVIATEDRRFWVAREPKVPVYGPELTQIFSDQKQLFQQGNYQQALRNILQQTWEKALSKQGDGTYKGGKVTSKSDSAGGFRDREPESDRGKSDKGSFFSHIPFWFWLVLILVIVPLICCCSIFYCCCCRKNSGSPRRQDQSDIGRGGPEGVTVGGGRNSSGQRSGIGGFLGALGGTGLSNLGGRLMGGKRGVDGGSRGGAIPGGAGPQNNVPRQPASKDDALGGRGLYPSAPVKDEGGGGGW